MGNLAIRFDGVSKRYHIGALRKANLTFREAITGTIMAGVRRIGRRLRSRNEAPSEDTIWALRDVCLEVKHGEVLGVIGRNGAGKSTLLKIVSRITEPTSGCGEVFGRVGSLLEVGTGFHPELTGRENIYLNGAILGMKRLEINRKFDEIVDFAEVAKFIDTPVKHYSTGMYLRLAFAVAAHLEPEILLVDEVLAVGDARFQKKCLQKMEDVGHEGRTVLFVSHNMPAITRLCQRAILLDEGHLVADGPAHGVVSRYLGSGAVLSGVREWPDPAKAPGGEIARLRAVRVRDENGQVTDAVDIRRPVDLEMEYDVLVPGYALMPNFQFVNEHGLHLFSTHDVDPAWRRRPRPAGRYVSVARIPGNFLAEGMLFVGAALVTIEPIFSQQFYERDAVAFQVVDTMEGDSARGDYAGIMSGVIRPLLSWRTRAYSDSAVSPA